MMVGFKLVIVGSPFSSAQITQMSLPLLSLLGIIGGKHLLIQSFNLSHKL